MKEHAALMAKEWLAGDIAILDTETTGLDDNAEIVEISIIDGQGRILLNTLVKPNAPIPKEATNIHGITNEMVANAPSWAQIRPDFLKAIAGRKLIIYNAGYDLRMLSQADKLGGFESSPLAADCAMLAYAEFYGAWDDREGREGWKWQKLTNAAKQCGINDIAGAHRALADVKMTLEVIKHMANYKKA